MAKEFKGLYEFGEFRLDAAERRLLKDGEPVQLTLKVFETLLVLVQRSGRLVEKDELMSEVWSDSFVEEANIARHISILRKALGDGEGNNRYIETVPKLGYRFVAPVREGAGAGTGAGVQPLIQTTGTDRFIRGGRKKAVGLRWVVVLGIVGIAVATYLLLFRSTEVASEKPIKSLAILPLKSLSGDPNDNYLGLGIADGIITKLSQAGTITVRPTSAVRKYADQHVEWLEAAKQLEVDAVLDGTEQRVGDRLRVSVNLLRTQDGVSLFADSFDVRLDDFFKVQDLVSGQIATRLRLKLRPTTLSNVDPKAYDLYMKAEFHTGLQNKNDNDAAIKLLEEAVALAPRFAPAYAALAGEYRNKGVFLYPSDTDWQEKAFSAANTALSLDPDLAEAHVSLGLLLWTPAKGFPHEAVIKEYRRALELNPNLDEAHHQLASVYNHIGLLDKGEEEIQKAIEINPGNTGARYRVGVNLMLQGKYSQALNAFVDSEKFNPGNWAYQMGWTLFQLGRRDESAAVVEKYLKEYPKDEGGLLTSMKAMLAAGRGDEREALENIQRAAEIGKGYGHFHHTAYAIASTYALLNDRELAVKWLTSAAADGLPCYPLFERDPNLANLREDPKFVTLMKRLKEQWEYYKSI